VRKNPNGKNCLSVVDLKLPDEGIFFRQSSGIINNEFNQYILFRAF
jgi:hypothetical protein